MEVLTNQYDIALPHESCLTEDELIRYANSICDLEEARQFDAHLGICALCSDAVDGIMSVPFAEAEAALNKLKQQTTLAQAIPVTPQAAKTPTIAPTVELQPRSRSRMWLTAAAATVGLAGGAVFLLTQGEPTPPTTPNDGLTATQTVQNATENANPNANLPLTKPKDSLGTAPPSIDSLATIENGTLAQNQPSQPADLAAATPKMEEKNQISTNKDNTPTVPTVVLSAPPPQVAETNSNVESDNAKVVTTSRMRPNPSPNAMPRVENRNNKTVAAEAKKEVTTAAKPSGFKVNESFQQGMAFMRSKKYVNAINEFEQVIQHQKSGDVYETALWQLGQAQFNAGKRIEARETFEKIVAEKGQFSAQAAERLKK